METGSAASVRRPSDRRALYRRSNTTSSLPLQALKPATSSSSAERRRQLEPIMDSPVRGPVVTAAAEVATRPQRAGRAPAARHGTTTDGKRTQLCRKASCNDLLLSASSASVPPLYPATATSELVDGTGGRLLSKVKERIRDTVLQTTPEWPAVMHERRQRAAIQFEMRAAKMIADEHRSAAETATTTDRVASKCAERKSIASTVVDRKEAARAAFRQNRSASCEDAVTTMTGGKLHPASAAAAAAGKTGRRERLGSPNSDITGIICSNKDLQSIIEQSRQEITADEKPISPSQTGSDDNADGTMLVTGVDNYQELLDESSPGTRRCPTGDENRKSLTVEVHVGCSEAEAAMSVSEAKSVDIDGDLLTPSTSDGVSVTTLKDVDSATGSEVAADCGAVSATRPSDVEYDAHGLTWDIYGAALNPEALGDAIQRHLQRIMLTASSIPGMSSQVAAVARASSKGSKGNDDLSAAAESEKQEKLSDDCPTERQRNFIQKFLRSFTKRRRSFNTQGSSN